MQISGVVAGLAATVALLAYASRLFPEPGAHARRSAGPGSDAQLLAGARLASLRTSASSITLPPETPSAACRSILKSASPPRISRSRPRQLHHRRPGHRPAPLRAARLAGRRLPTPRHRPPPRQARRCGPPGHPPPLLATHAQHRQASVVSARPDTPGPALWPFAAPTSKPIGGQDAVFTLTDARGSTLIFKDPADHQQVRHCRGAVPASSEGIREGLYNVACSVGDTQKAACEHRDSQVLPAAIQGRAGGGPPYYAPEPGPSTACSTRPISSRPTRQRRASVDVRLQSAGLEETSRYMRLRAGRTSARPCDV